MKRNDLLKAGAALLLMAMPFQSEAQKKKDLEFSHYLFAFFSDNSPYGEQVRYAISEDGFNYTSLNDGKPIISSDKIANKKGIRDPHIIRSEDGKYFYMVMTDMRSSEGWQSNDGLVLMKSTDMINWEHTAIHFPDRYPNLEGFDEANLHAVWAPQTIWDPKEEKYMVYYSIGRHDWEYPVGDRHQPYFKIFYSYANEDFTDLTEPKLLFDFGTAAIDGDIIWDEKEQQYILFFKDEGLSTINNGFRTRQGVMRAVSKDLTGPYTTEYRHVQQTDKIVEGSSVFQLINSDKFILMYDCYADGYYQFCESDNLKDFRHVQNTATHGNFTPRHGSVMHITKEEKERLCTWSDLSLTRQKLNDIPVPSFTLKELDKRNQLLEEAQTVLHSESDTKALNKTKKKLDKFCKKY